MPGKTLNLKIYVTGENLEKLKQIREYLNNKSDVYALLFNDAINNFKL